MDKRDKKGEKSMNKSEYLLPLCMILGMSLGTALGSAVGNLVLGMCTGLGIGCGLGMILSLLQDKNRSRWTQLPILLGMLMILGGILILYFGLIQ